MLTLLLLISIIQGWSSIRQGVARREASFSKLVSSVRRYFFHVYNRGPLNIPAFNKIFKTVAPLDVIIRFIFQLWYRLPNNICEQIKHVRFWLHLRAICRKWETVLCDFKEGDTQRPHV